MLLTLFSFLAFPALSYADTLPTVFSDNFTDADGTPLATHNSNWTVFDGAPAIQNNTLSFQPGGYFGLPNNVLGDQCSSFDFQYPSLGAVNLFVRIQPNGHGYGSYINQNGSNYDFALYHDDNQYFTTFTLPALSSGWHNYQLCAVGSQVTASLDNSVLASATDTRFTQGYPTLAISTGNYIDNYLLEGTTPSPTPTPTETPTPTPVPQNNLTGNVYVDANSNGVKDTGENNYQGATVTLSVDTGNPSGTSQQTATTDANGNYSFTGVPSGNYWMSLAVPAGYTGTTRALVNVVVNDNITENFGIAQQPSAPPTVFSDNFTDANGTTLTAHNSNWTVFDGAPAIQNNTLSFQPGGYFGLPNTILADQCSSLDFQYPSFGVINLFVRIQPNGHGYGTYINSNNGNYDFALYHDDNQYYGVGFSFPSSALSTGWHNYQLCAVGSQVTASLDNSVLASATDTRFTQGYPTLAISTGNYIDNYLLATTNRAPSVGAITVSPNPVQVNNATTASANFTDADTGDTHTAQWNWGDGSTTGSVTESNGSGSVSDSHTYSAAGVYTVTLTVTDSAGASNTSTFQYVSVYNPTSQGLFSAGHSFNSPAGAYAQNSNLTGNVTFGLAYKYQGTVPTSNREFTMNFKAANLLFNATTISSLVVANSMATLTGTGTINGSGNYNFLVTGVDGGDIRIQITDPANNNTVIYDTQPGAAATATPTTSVNGQVIAHN